MCQVKKFLLIHMYMYGNMSHYSLNGMCRKASKRMECDLVNNYIWLIKIMFLFRLFEILYHGMCVSYFCAFCMCNVHILLTC